MNTYLCSLNCGDEDLDAVVMRIDAPTRGKAKAALLAAANDAGFGVDWTTRCNIRRAEAAMNAAASADADAGRAGDGGAT